MDRREALWTWLTIILLACSVVWMMFSSKMFGGQVRDDDNPEVPYHIGTGLYYFGEFSDTDTHIWVRPAAINKIMLARRRGVRGEIDDWEVTINIGGVMQRILFKTEAAAKKSVEKALDEIHKIDLGRKRSEAAYLQKRKRADN